MQVNDKLYVAAKSDKKGIDITRYVKYPRYIRVQRQKAILQARMKVPGVVNMIHTPVSRPLNVEILNLANKYATETKEAHKERLAKEEKTEKPLCLTTGINAVTTAVEKQQAKLVLIAKDVYPEEVFLFVPTLCHKMHVPFAIVNNKAELGKLCHAKTCSAVCFTSVKPEDQAAFDAILAKVHEEVDYQHMMQHYGGNQKSTRSIQKEQKQAAKK